MPFTRQGRTNWENIPRLSPATEQTMLTSIFLQPIPFTMYLFSFTPCMPFARQGQRHLGKHPTTQSSYRANYVYIHFHPTTSFTVTPFSFTPLPQPLTRQGQNQLGINPTTQSGHRATYTYIYAHFPSTHTLHRGFLFLHATPSNRQVQTDWELIPRKCMVFSSLIL